MIVLHFKFAREDMIEHTNDICHVVSFQYAKGEDTIEHVDNNSHVSASWYL